MTTPISQEMDDAIRGHAIGDMCDRIWAIAGCAVDAEQWLPCPGYEGRYEVSSFGRIRSLLRIEPTSAGCRRTIRGGVLNPSLNAQGYPHVSLRKNGKLRLVRLHRLIALAFHGDKQNALHNEVAHLDNDRANARADNLKWVSTVENHAHMIIHGTLPRGEKNANAILTDRQAAIVKGDKSKTAREWAQILGVSHHTIRGIRCGKRYAHVKPIIDYRKENDNGRG